MANPERSQREIWGSRVRNGGIVAAIIGLIAQSSSVLIGGVSMVAGGEIFRGIGKRSTRG